MPFPQLSDKIHLGLTYGVQDGWKWASTADDAIDMLTYNEISHINMELAEGYEVLKWIENEVLTSAYEPPKMTVGKVNDVDRRKMENVIQNILRLYEVANTEYDDGYDEIGKMRDYY